MGAAQFRDGETLFLCRVGGVAVNLGRVLLHRSEHEDFWAVPGGRIEVGETSEQALKREMREELGAEVGVGRLLWVVENFFRHTPLDEPPDSPARMGHHELGLYLEMQVSPDLAAMESFAGAELIGTQHEFALEYRWFEPSEIATLDVRPAAFRELLNQPLPTGATRLVSTG